MFRIITQENNAGIFVDALKALGIPFKKINCDDQNDLPGGIVEILGENIKRNPRIVICSMVKGLRFRFPFLLHGDTVISCGVPTSNDYSEEVVKLKRLLKMYKED